MLRKFLMGVIALAMPSAAEAADLDSYGGQFMGDLDVGVAYVMPEGDNDGFGLGGGGSGVLKLGESNFFIQGDAHYSHAFVDKGDETEHGVVEGKAFWRSPDSGLFGVSAGYEKIGAGNFDYDIGKAGLMSQIYGSEIVTFSLGTGLYTGDDQDKKNIDGYYLQGGVNFYLNDRVAAGGGATYMEVDKNPDDIFALNFKGEYLLPTAMPFSLTMGYNYSDVTSVQTHAAMFGFKMYFGGGGEGESLSSIHRGGSADNGNPAIPLLGY
jgi:hypothetical protein